jgi:hypothetical protein
VIVITDDVVLTAAEVASGIGADNPRIGYHNIVTADNIAASGSDTDWPVTNLGSPVTYLKWQGASTSQHTLTVTPSPAEVVNYFGLAGHNLGSGGIAVKLQQSFNGSTWADLCDEFIPADDYALMVEFADTTASAYYRLVLTPGGVTIPQVAAFNLGRVLRMQRRLYVGFEPPTLNPKTTVSSGRSESGQFLGRVRRSQMLENAAEFKNLTAAWVRTYFKPFQTAAETLPFFFAWRPSTYPTEVGYMWLKDDPALVNEQANGMMAASIKMQGIP